MAGETRVKKVSDLLLQVISKTLRSDISDPRLRLISFSGVDMSKDLSHAQVFVSTLGDESNVPEVLKALARAEGFFKRAIAKECQLRIVPHLHFHHDRSSLNSHHISSLIDKALESDAAEKE